MQGYRSTYGPHSKGFEEGRSKVCCRSGDRSVGGRYVGKSVDVVEGRRWEKLGLGRSESLVRKAEILFVMLVKLKSEDLKGAPE